MAPRAPFLSGLLCAAGVSIITGHDGPHQLILTEQETFTSLSFSLLPQRICLSVMPHFLYACRISAWFGSSLTKGWYCGTKAEVPVYYHKQPVCLKSSYRDRTFPSPARQMLPFCHGPPGTLRCQAETGLMDLQCRAVHVSIRWLEPMT